MSLKKALLWVFIVLLIDQISKIYIKTNFLLGEEIYVFDWFRIRFIENEGMAWGVKLPGDYGKLALTLFRIIAVGGILYWLNDSIKKKQSKTIDFCYLVSISRCFGQYYRFSFLWCNF